MKVCGKMNNICKNILKKIKFLFITLVIVFLIFIILLNLYYKISNKNYNTLKIFNYEFYIEMSSSMNDEIKVGDIVIIKTNFQKLKTGDIISFEDEDKNIITHRILKIQESDENILYKTKGDANNTADIDLVNKNKIRGVYIGKISSNIAKILLVTLVVFIVILLK